VLAVAAAIVMLGAAGCTSGDGGGVGTDTPADLAPEPTATADGWRTESFGDAEISVPDNWGHQTGDVAATLWCISDAAVSLPVVIRPGIPVEPTCPGPEGDAPDPATLVEKAGQFVSMIFISNDPDAELGAQGDRVTTKTGSVLVRVQAAASIRSQILATLKQVTVDASGCPVTDPISHAPARRPDPPFSVLEIKGIKSVAACRYAIPGGQFANPPDTDEAAASADPGATDPAGIQLSSNAALPGEDPSAPIVDEPTIDPGADLRPTARPLLPADTPRTAPTLLSSVLLSGDAAREAIHRVAESKVGAGPDSAGGCTGSAEDQVRGTEEIVLRVTANSDNTLIYLRYGGCHNGFDDGFTERALTREAVAPFVSEANLVPLYGEELLRILDDQNAPATSGHTEEDQATAPPANLGGATGPPDSG
jgi:hypothetical protein